MVFSSLFKRNPVVAKYCGHEVRQQTDDVTVLNRTIQTKMPRNETGGYDFCHKCLGDMGIKCWICGGPIFIGDPITLYSPRDEKSVPDYAAVYSVDPLRLVGCGNPDCAATGADYAGYWLPAKEQRDGKWVGGVARFESALEKVMRTGDMAITHNLSDPSETKPDSRILIPTRMEAIA